MIIKIPHRLFRADLYALPIATENILAGEICDILILPSVDDKQSYVACVSSPTTPSGMSEFEVDLAARGMSLTRVLKGESVMLAATEAHGRQLVPHPDFEAGDIWVIPIESKPLNKAWRALPAGRGLDRVVAELLNWRIDYVDSDGAREFSLYKPDGALVAHIRYLIGFSIDEMWNMLLNAAKAPHWSTDANTAAQLWEQHKPKRKSGRFYPDNPNSSSWRSDVVNYAVAPLSDEAFTGTLADVLTRCWIAAKEQDALR